MKRRPGVGAGATREKFRRAFEHAPIGILLLDGDARIVQANAAVCAMLGYGAAEILGRLVTELVHPDDRAESERMRELVRRGMVDRFAAERRALHRDGRLLWLQIHTSVQRTPDRSVQVIISQIVDVTGQRAREAALRDSEARLRTIFDEAPIGMALIAPAGGLLQVNRALATMLRRSSEELERLTVQDVVYPEDLEETAARVAAVLAGRGRTIHGASRYVRSDGAIVWGEYQSSLVSDAEGVPRYFVCQVVDVTERKLAEDGLRASEARYRGLVEDSQDLIVRMDLDGNLSFVNDAWCAKFGFRREEILGRSVMPRIVSADQQRAAQALQRLRVSPHRSRVEIQQETVEGLRWVEWEGCGILDERGLVIELQGIGRDVTHAHEVDEALRASEARYRGVVESQQAVVLRVDLEQRLTFVNDYGCRVLGLDREKILGREGLAWVYGEDRDAVMRAFASVFEPPQRARVECRIVVRGELRWFEWEGMLIVDDECGPVELQAIGIDVTERRAAAEQLRASLEELRRSEEKLRLLAQRQTAVREEERKRVGFDLHDDVCQELIGVGMLVESVRSRHAAVLGGAGEDLRRVTAHLNEVVEHLRLLAGELRPMLLHDLGLEGSLRSLALGFAAGATQVEATFVGPVPRLDEATEVTVYRIAQEAVTNALRHADARHVEVRLAVDEGRLALSIRDDGCGFDPARRRIAALGLLSMEERALALGGRLEIASTPGAGTTVRLDCPLACRTAPLRV